MMRNTFNKDWKFTDSHGNTKKIDLPYDAMIFEARDPSCGNGINSGFFPGGRYVYEKEFDLNEEDLEKALFIHFECVYRKAKVWLNDVLLMSHEYGYTPFDVDLLPSARIGKNHLKVEADNSLEPNCRWYSGSGIFRDVCLIRKEKDHICDLKVKTLSYDPVIVEIKAKTIEGSQIQVEIFDKEEKIYEGTLGRIELKDIRLWSEEDPYLYTIRVSSKKDSKEIKYGFRRLEWDGKNGLRVNGKSVLLRGGCIHHDHGIIGANEYYDAEYRRMKILKENGFNALRMAHNPASEIQLQIADELGLYLMNEIYDGWYIPKTYHDHSRDFEKCWKEDLRTMVETSYNHPCVIMYSIGNEVSETAEQKGVDTCKILKDYVKDLDDSRPVTAGINVLLNVYANMGMGVYKQKGEYKAEPLQNNKEYKDKPVGSAFFNMTAQKLGKLLFFMSKGRKGDRACKGAAENLDIIGLNYASSRYDDDVKNYPDRMMVGSETMVADLPYNWQRVKKYPQLVGDFVWSAWDYLGEACVGDWTYPSYKGLPLLAGQGMIDITGKPLASMYFMQVVWGLRKKPFIAVSPLNHNDEIPHKGSWQFTNAIDSYSWDGYEGKKVDCEVYGQGEKVELLLNGKSLGVKHYKEFKARFRFPYKAGTLTARSLDKDGKVLSEHSLHSGEKETLLHVSSDKQILQPGKDELVCLDIRFADKNGELKPYIEDEVRVEVNGPLELIGLGSSLCKSDERFDSDRHHAYRGALQGILKVKGETGTAEIKVSCPGYTSVIKKIEVTKDE